MRRHYCAMMAAKLGVQAFGHGVRPLAWIPKIGVIASTRKKRAP
ncbi:MAG TPA: hypothetical protein VGP61_07175 [Gemmatimonadales bacterium]|jgi:hypothetical protein|nr:hypothetical protein [Gemmatimonadales bacterium]